MVKDAAMRILSALSEGAVEKYLSVSGRGTVSYLSSERNSLNELRIFGALPSDLTEGSPGIITEDGKLLVRIHGNAYLDGGGFEDRLRERYPEYIGESSNGYFLYKGSNEGAATFFDPRDIKLPSGGITLSMTVNAEAAGTIVPGICLLGDYSSYAVKGTATAPGDTELSLKSTLKLQGVGHRRVSGAGDVMINKKSFMLYSGNSKPSEYWCARCEVDIGEPLLAAQNGFTTVRDELELVEGRLTRRIGMIKISADTELEPIKIAGYLCYKIALPTPAGKPWAYSERLPFYSDMSELISSLDGMIMDPGLEAIYMYVSEEMLADASIAEYFNGVIITYPLRDEVVSETVTVGDVTRVGDIIIEACSVNDAEIEIRYKE